MAEDFGRGNSGVDTSKTLWTGDPMLTRLFFGARAFVVFVDPVERHSKMMRYTHPYSSVLLKIRTSLHDSSCIWPTVKESVHGVN